MDGPILALLLTTIVHIVGMVVLFALMGRDILDAFRGAPRREGGDEGWEPDPQPAPAPTGGGGGIPLPDAEPARVRLRRPGRIGEQYPRAPRRPEHPEPVRAPERELV